MLLLIIPFICPFFFLTSKTFQFSALITVFKCCIHIERDQVYCEKQKQDSVVNFCLLFHYLAHLSQRLIVELIV